jgi:hypothetical protein
LMPVSVSWHCDCKQPMRGKDESRKRSCGKRASPRINSSGSSRGRSCCRGFMLGDLLCPALPVLDASCSAHQESFEVLSRVNDNPDERPLQGLSYPNGNFLSKRLGARSARKPADGIVLGQRAPSGTTRLALRATLGTCCRHLTTPTAVHLFP